MSNTNLVAVRDLPIPAELHETVQYIREGVDMVDDAFRSICGQAVLTGFRLLHIKNAIGIGRGGRPEKGSNALSWKELAPRITGRKYQATRIYERLAEDLVEDEPALSALVETRLEEHSREEQKRYLETIRDRISGHTIASLAIALGHAKEQARADSNPNGNNGADALPLTPEEKRQQLEFRALTSWFGCTDPDKIKPGSPAFALLREVGLQTDPDGKPAEATWPHLPRESVEQLAPALEKLAAEMKARLREQR